MKINEIKKEDVGNEVSLSGILTITITNTTDNTDQYLRLVLSDGTGNVYLSVFKNKDNTKVIQELLKLTSGDKVILKGIVKDVRGENSKYTTLSKITYISYLISGASQTYIMKEVENSIIKQYRSIKNPQLKSIVKKILKNRNFWDAPYSQKNLYAFKGGLACYTYDLLNLINDISKTLYVGDIELLKVCACIHRYGKTLTYKVDGKNIERTLEGNLNGDSMYNTIAVSLVLNDTNDVDDSLKALILHIVGASKGKAEWGAATLPKAIEARVLHLCDRMVLESCEAKEKYYEAKNADTNFLESTSGTFYFPLNDNNKKDEV